MILTELAHKIAYGTLSLVMLVGFTLLLHRAAKESKRRAARQNLQHKLAQSCQHQKRKDHARNFGHYEG